MAVTRFPMGMTEKGQTGRSVRLSGALRLAGEEGFAPWCLDAFWERMGRKPGDSGMTLRLVRKSSLPEEGYRLQVTEREVTVEAGEERGVIWALTALALMMEQEMIPLGEWTDAPVLGHRGLMADAVNCFLSPAELRVLIEALSLSRGNVLHLRLAGEAACRVESRVYPSLSGAGPAYTLEELSGLALFARSRGVELLPEFDLPARAGAILQALPKLGCSSLPGENHTLCAGKKTSYDFARAFLEEAAPVFPGGRVHLGGRWADLTEWRACPQCQAKMIAQGSVSVVGLEGYFVNRCAQFLEKLGKKAVVYSDALSRDLSAGVQVQYWDPEAEGEMKTFRENGGQWIASDVYDLFLNFPPAMIPLERVYEAASSLGKGKHPGLLGAEAVLFTKGLGSFSQVQERLFPRIFALTEAAWSGGGNYQDFCARLEVFLSHPLLRGIRVSPREQWDPQGGERKKAAVDYARSLQGEPWPWRRQPASQEAVSLFKKKFFRPMDLLIMPRGIL